MPLEEPSWWYGPPGASAARMLRPAGWLYGWAARLRFARARPYRSTLPVICIGNFTAGGTGKTPAALYVAQYLISRGERPAFLTRGYGGTIKGPHWVDNESDSAAAAGDEALLLARRGPTMIARDRAAGARAIEAARDKASVIVMDDGLQNPILAKDLVLAVVDGARGLGNTMVIPAGPLRAPLDFQLGLADAVIINRPALAQSAPGASAWQDDRKSGHGAGEGVPDGAGTWTGWLLRGFTGPLFEAQTGPSGDVSWLRGAPVLAFAGIGAPARFFGLLEHLGARLVATRSFPDHHVFSEEEAGELIAAARSKSAALVTTEKDLVRIHGKSPALSALKSQSLPLPIELTFAPPHDGDLAALLDKAIRLWRQGCE